jgi:tryptophan synthase beta subunit
MAVLLDTGMSVHHVAVAMATAVEALDLAVIYMNEAKRPHQQLAVLLGTLCIVCIFLSGT